MGETEAGGGARGAGERYLLLRLSAFGDVVHALPVLSRLREARPGARIAWAVEPLGARLLEGHPELDELLRLPRGWYRSPGGLLAARRRVRAFRPTATIDPQGLTKSALLGWLSGARRRVGFGGADGREASPLLNTERVRAGARHVVDRNLELLRPLGIETPPGAARFVVPEDPAAERAVGAWRAEAGLAEGYAVMNPGAGWASKRWPPERYRAVAGRLFAGHGCPVVVVWAGARERAWAETIAAAEGVRLAPETDLGGLGALLRRARLCIGSDTGPLHLAAALGVPCVGLYGPTSAERNGPYGDGHRVLQPHPPAPGAGRGRRAGPEAMDAIDVPAVAAAAASLLETNGADGC